MNILFVLQRYPGFGGIESVTRMLAKEFVDRFNFCVTVFSTSRQDVPSQIIKNDLFNYRTTDLKGSKLKNYFDMLVNEVNPDFIIYQDSYLPEEFLLEHLPQDVKIIVCEHNTPDCLEIGLRYVIKNLSWKNPLNIFRKLCIPYKVYKLHKETTAHHIRMLQLSDRYLILSESFRPILRNFFHIKSPKILSMPNPIEIPKETIDFNRLPNQALFVGRLTDQKGIKYLIELWTRIEPRCDWNLLVVGDGDKRSYIEKEIRSRRLQRIKLIGFQQNTSRFFLESSVHFMTSIYEGFGITNLESAIRGTIPFAFDSFASVRDIIVNKETGYLIKPFDVDTYAETFLSFIQRSQSDIAAMRYRAYEKARKYSLPLIVEKWNNLFNEMK